MGIVSMEPEVVLVDECAMAGWTLIRLVLGDTVQVDASQMSCQAMVVPKAAAEDVEPRVTSAEGDCLCDADKTPPDPLFAHGAGQDGSLQFLDLLLWRAYSVQFRRGQGCSQFRQVRT